MVCPSGHEHINLEGSTRCKRAQIYIQGNYARRCEKLSGQNQADAMNLVALEILNIAELTSFDDNLHDDPCSDMQYIATDDVSGGPLKPNMVIAALKEELDYFKSMHVYVYAPLSE